MNSRLRLPIVKTVRMSRVNVTRHLHYAQGQTPGKFREYFYFIDHQGMLFLDDSRMKNFTSCLKELKFLEFFFKALRRNDTDSYADSFPWLSPCGREKNYIRCDDTPFVFNKLIQEENNWLLAYNHGPKSMSLAFQPEKMCMLPETGRLYHPAPGKVGGAGLIKSSLSIELSSNFVYEKDEHVPFSFKFQDSVIQLTQELQPILRADPLRLLKTDY
jgi:hypothetical protein